MKLQILALIMLLCLQGQPVLAKKADLYSSKYYVFQSSLPLNAHLFLYDRATRCKYEGRHNDSLAYYAFKEKWGDFSVTDRSALNALLRFYKDSLLSKDLLSDSLMRNFEDHLSSEGYSRSRLKSWQTSAFEALRAFQPYFVKFYWPAIDSLNKAWLAVHKSEVASMETAVVLELERIYKTKLPDGKIRVDLCCYATGAGVYSFRETGPHIIFSTSYIANRDAMAAEVVFHETSHFLAEKLMEQIKTASQVKKRKVDPGLWHNMLLYTTGFVMEKEYRLKWQKYEPYYLQMKLREKLPEFSMCMDACRLFWDPYLHNEVSFDAAVTNLVTYISNKN